MFLEKLARIAHLREASLRSENLSMQVAQAAAQDITAIDAKKVDKADIDEIIHGLHAAIFSGEVPAALYSSSGAAITTDSGIEIYAVKKFLTERGG